MINRDAQTHGQIDDQMDLGSEKSVMNTSPAEAASTQPAPFRNSPSCEFLNTCDAVSTATGTCWVQRAWNSLQSHRWESGQVPQCLPHLLLGAPRHVLHSPTGPQGDPAPSAHSIHLLFDMPFVSFFPFLSHFQIGLPILLEVTFQANCFHQIHDSGSTFGRPNGTTISATCLF